MNQAYRSPAAKTAVQQAYQQLLNQLNLPTQEQHLNTSFGSTYVLSCGLSHLPPLVLLHGSSINSAMWFGDLPQLSRHYAVYAVDLPGEPGQSDPNQLPFDTDAYADWLAEVWAVLGLNQAVLVGASLGAWLATKFSCRFPEQVAQLVLLCPAGIGPQNHAFKDLAARLLSQGEAGVDELFCRLNGGQPVPASVLNYSKLIGACFNARQEPIPMFTDAELRQLSMPCALFVGAKDLVLDSQATVERLAALVPQADINWLPEQGHSLYRLAKEIIGFLQR